MITSSRARPRAPQPLSLLIRSSLVSAKNPNHLPSGRLTVLVYSAVILRVVCSHSLNRVAASISLLAVRCAWAEQSLFHSSLCALGLNIAWHLADAESFYGVNESST